LSRPVDKPVWLAGGLNPDNVGEAIHTVRPFAVDVSSGVETQPGIKSVTRMSAFVEAVRAAENELTNGKRR
jgi:phosphoribosylanthranilate isomerase